MLPGALSVCLRDFKTARGEKIIVKQVLGIGENFKWLYSAQKVTIQVKEFQIQAYQLTGSGEPLLLFTHRQIGEAVGKTKGTAQLASLKGKGQRAKGKSR